MAEDSFKNLVFAFLLMSAFAVLLATAIGSIGTTYDKDTIDVAGLNTERYNASITNIRESAERLQSDFNDQSIWSAIAGVVVEGIFGIGKEMITFVTLPSDILIDTMSDIFNIPPVITGVVVALIILSVIFGIWALLKVGN